MPTSYIRRSATRSAVETIIPRFLHAALAKLPHLLHLVLPPSGSKQDRPNFQATTFTFSFDCMSSLLLEETSRLLRQLNFLFEAQGVADPFPTPKPHLQIS